MPILYIIYKKKHAVIKGKPCKRGPKPDYLSGAIIKKIIIK